jgi:hypothetical protein
MKTFLALVLEGFVIAVIAMVVVRLTTPAQGCPSVENRA